MIPFQLRITLDHYLLPSDSCSGIKLQWFLFWSLTFLFYLPFLAQRRKKWKENNFVFFPFKGKLYCFVWGRYGGGIESEVRAFAHCEKVIQNFPDFKGITHWNENTRGGAYEDVSVASVYGVGKGSVQKTLFCLFNQVITL